MLIRKGDLVSFETGEGGRVTGVATENERPSGTCRLALKGGKFKVPRADDIMAYAFCMAWEDEELEELQEKYSDWKEDGDYF